MRCSFIQHSQINKYQSRSKFTSWFIEGLSVIAVCRINKVNVLFVRNFQQFRHLYKELKNNAKNSVKFLCENREWSANDMNENQIHRYAVNEEGLERYTILTCKDLKKVYWWGKQVYVKQLN